MTKFRRINLEQSNKKHPKKTVFNHYVTSNLEVETVTTSPNNWKVVVHIGTDKEYGDVFIVYDDSPDRFTIYFGEAGDEFENNGE